VLIAACLFFPAFPKTSLAEGTRKALAPSASPEAQAAARDHFQRARELYQAGSYHEAIAELEAALALDPYAKDLVFNLGVVSEKLGNIDDALRHFRHYSEMDLQPAERARAESLIKRLEGAKREVKPEEKAPAQARQPAEAHGERPSQSPAHGRIDVLTLSAAVIAVGGIAVGTIFGVKALSDNPQSDGHYASYSAYLREQNDAESAHREAKVSDVAFVVGGAALVATVALFLLRTKDPKASQSVGVSAAPLAGGACAFVGGSF
jgi:tetratricopeptide (TPR) repeat protein